MILNGHTKVELQSCDVQMREGLGDYAEYHQPRQVREQTRSGRLKIKQSEGKTLPAKQHPQYHLAVKIVKEREHEQRIAGETLCRENSKQTHLLLRLKGISGGQVRGGINRGKRTNNSTIACSPKQVGVPLMIHCWRTSEQIVKPPTPHKPRLSSKLLHSNIVQSQDFSILSLAFSSQVSALCCAHRRSWILLVLCVHTTLIHCGPQWVHLYAERRTIPPYVNFYEIFGRFCGRSFAALGVDVHPSGRLRSHRSLNTQEEKFATNLLMTKSPTQRHLSPPLAG